MMPITSPGVPGQSPTSNQAAVTCERAFPGVVSSVPQARAYVRQALAQASTQVPELPDGVGADAATCVSELAANAVRHTASGAPGGCYRLLVQIDASDGTCPGSRLVVRVEVLDQGSPHTPFVQPTTQPGRDGAEESFSGRGLRICAALGVLCYADAPPGGRRVWVELVHPAAALPAAASALAERPGVTAVHMPGPAPADLLTPDHRTGATHDHL